METKPLARWISVTDHRLRRAVPALLRRLSLDKYCNFSHGLSLGGRDYQIPIQGGTGESLLKLEPGFLSAVCKGLGSELPDCVVDVGANIGQSLLELYSQRHWTTCCALEPNPFASSYLAELASLNELPITIFPWAAGDSPMPNRFALTSPIDAAATMAPDGRPGVYDPSHYRWVATYPLDVLCDIAALVPGFLLKIDVEGFETQVLLGADKILDWLRPVVVCEVLRPIRKCEVEVAHERMGRLEAILRRKRYDIVAIDLENGTAGEILGFRQIQNFPRGVWSENPSGIDYVFLPSERPGLIGLIDDSQ